TRAVCSIAAPSAKFNPAPRFRRSISAVPEDKYLDISGLDAGYGRSQVLFGVTLNVPWRGGVAILGRNGAGKTTLMKAIVGELPLLGGSITLDMREVGQLPTEQRIRLGVGYVPQEHSIFARLSVRDNLAVGEQHLDLALQVASRAYVLDRGRVALTGSAAEVRHDPRLLQFMAP